MPSERAIVETLNRKELLELVNYFDLDVADRRVRDHLVDAIATAPDLTLAELLEQLPVATLKGLCVKHGLSVQGRGKAAYVASIAEGVAPKAGQSAKNRATGRIKAVKAAPKAAKPKSSAKAKSKPAAKAKPAVKAKPVAKTKPADKAKAKPQPKAKPAAKAEAAPKAKAKPAAKLTAVAKAKARTKPAPAAKVPAKMKPAPKAKAASKPQAITEVVDLAAAPSKRPRAAKAAKSVRAKPVSVETSVVQAKSPQAASKAQAPAVKKAKSVALPSAPEPTEAPAPPPPPNNVISLPYVNTPAAVAAAEAAATHLRATSDPSLWAQPTTRTQKCASCATKLELRKCTAQKCNNMLVASPTRKICAECMFERNTLSMDDFNARMEEEANCPHCGKVWQQD